MPARPIVAASSLAQAAACGHGWCDPLVCALDGLGLAETVGLGKRSRLEPPEPPNRYQRRRPGKLVHVDIKQLGRISERSAGHRMVGHRKSQGAAR